MVEASLSEGELTSKQKVEPSSWSRINVIIKIMELPKRVNLVDFYTALPFGAKGKAIFPELG